MLKRIEKHTFRSRQRPRRQRQRRQRKRRQRQRRQRQRHQRQRRQRQRRQHSCRTNRVADERDAACSQRAVWWSSAELRMSSE